MMKIILQIMTLHLAILIVFSSAYAQSGSKIKVARIDSEISRIEAGLNGLKSNLGAILREIDGQKRSQEKSFSILREIKIEGLLKKAKSLTDEISRLDSQKSGLEREMLAGRKDYIALLNRDIDALMSSVRGNPSNKSALAELKKLVMERAALTQDLIPTCRGGADSMHIYPGDSPEDLIAKSQILEDYKARLTNDLRLTSEKLYASKKQKSAYNEIIHLLEEENFFTETAFFKSIKRDGASIASKSQPLASDDNSDANPSEPEDPLSEPFNPGQPAGETAPETTVDTDNGQSTLNAEIPRIRDIDHGLKSSSGKSEEAPQRMPKSSLDAKIALLEREKSNLAKLIKEIDFKIKSLRSEAERIKKSSTKVN